MKAATLDDLHGDTVVATINISLCRSGMMRIDGSITDEAFTLYMLDTARETMVGYHAKQKLGMRSPILVPAYDTALVGTPEEKQLLAARHELADAQ